MIFAGVIYLYVIPLGLTLSIPDPATGQSYKHKKRVHDRKQVFISEPFLCL
jgi:hypothetical protein